MKKITGILFAFCFMLAGCESFLEEENKASITNNELYKTAVGYETLRVNAYSTLRTIYRTDPYVLMAGTDMYQMTRGVTINGLYDYVTLYPDNGDVKTFYSNIYNSLQYVNAALYYIDHPTDLSETTKSVYWGEMHFLRGFYHFLLVEQFGRIAINDEFTQTPRINMSRTETLAESYDFVIAELTEALNSAIPTTTNDGTICKDIVNHYLGKVYLTRGWDLGNSADFATAKNHFSQVFTNRGNQLQLTFDRLWSPDHENNNEVIFAVQYDASSLASSTTGNNQEALFGSYLGGQERWHKYTSGALMPSWSAHSWFDKNDQRYDDTFMLTMWNYYHDYYQGKAVPGENTVAAVWPRAWDRAAELEADYRELTNNLTLYSFQDPDDIAAMCAFIKKWIPGFENVAPEDIPSWNTGGTNQTRIYAFFESNANTLTNEQYWRTAYQTDFCQPVVKKFDMPEQIQWSQTQSYRDIVLASLSETMLLYAEACIATEDYTTAQQYINKVLERPGNAKDGGKLEITLPTTKTAALEAYHKESAKELLGQYCGRWPELRRTGMLKHMYYNYNFDYRNTSQGVDVIGQKLYRPIPQDAIDNNDGISGEDQNPGYNQ